MHCVPTPSLFCFNCFHCLRHCWLLWDLKSAYTTAAHLCNAYSITACRYNWNISACCHFTVTLGRYTVYALKEPLLPCMGAFKMSFMYTHTVLYCRAAGLIHYEQYAAFQLIVWSIKSQKQFKCNKDHLHVLFCPITKPWRIQLTIAEDKQRQQILTIEKLEQANDWLFLSWKIT